MRLVLDNLKKSFGAKEVLKGASFTFEKGKIYALLGRNGAGKTTLFNCLNHDLEVNDGSFYIMNNKQKRKVLPDDIGYVLADPILPEFLTGYEYLSFYIDINKDRIKQLKTIEEYFAMVDLKEEDQYLLIKDYSHGMKNKVQMLSYLITKPDILLLDEPLTSLDVVVAEEMKKILKDIKNDHIIIFSTHILELARSLCDEIIILNNGGLEVLDHKLLKRKEFTTQIMDILKDNHHA